MIKRKRSASAAEIINTKFKTMGFTGEWLEIFGDPERRGSWIIWGESGNGKTSFCMQLAKYLSNFGRVAYDSLEEGFSLSLKKSIIRANMQECGSRFQVINKESIDDLRVRLSKKKSPDFIFIDSVQYTGLNKMTAKQLINDFPTKLFIFVSHAEGKLPDGRVAKAIRYDADIKIRIEGFKAIVNGRFEGDRNKMYTIWEQGAYDYWGAQMEAAAY